ncbi:MAG TPA: TldD/PmbA family protein [Nitrososphaerales archaeon]
MRISLDELHKVLQSISNVTYAEARYQSRVRNEISVGNGEIEEAKSSRITGVGFRVLVDGSWGFSSSNSLSTDSLMSTFKDAFDMARVSSEAKKKRIKCLAETRLAKGVFRQRINGPLEDHSLDEKIKLVIETEKSTRKHFEAVKHANCVYRELIDHKIIASTDGASAEVFDSKPEFRVTAVSSRNGDMISASETVGVTGGWEDLFQKKSADYMSKKAAETASRLIDAKHPKGERATVILDHGMVGLIAHEAIGHTVEADFVLSGSILAGKIGEKVANSLVTLVDSGLSDIVDGASGTVLVDDEGVPTNSTVVIEKGVLKSYLHNRETAAEFNVQPTGNARAFNYSDEPIIRMRNTYIEPGDYSFDEMVKEVKHGYLLKGPRSGQADANGEFMFGAQEAYIIDNGVVNDLLRGVTITGRALDVLQTVDALGKEFAYDIGAGYCGKGQMAKVDGGGPYLRCSALIGGVQ